MESFPPHPKGVVTDAEGASPRMGSPQKPQPSPRSVEASDEEWTHAEEIPTRRSCPEMPDRYARSFESSPERPPSRRRARHVDASHSAPNPDPLNDLFRQIRGINLEGEKDVSLTHHELHNLLLNARRYARFATMTTQLEDRKTLTSDPSMKLAIAESQCVMAEIQAAHLQLMEIILERTQARDV